MLGNVYRQGFPFPSPLPASDRRSAHLNTLKKVFPLCDSSPPSGRRCTRTGPLGPSSVNAESAYFQSNCGQKEDFKQREQKGVRTVWEPNVWKQPDEMIRLQMCVCTSNGLFRLAQILRQYAEPNPTILTAGISIQSHSQSSTQQGHTPGCANSGFATSRLGPQWGGRGHMGHIPSFEARPKDETPNKTILVHCE